ncbi:MAG: PIG-L family deacetylase [Verrucomicrobia bacterium]|nr:PIG-L family deacetylase [Verrucomicrobiota bacterium]MCH8514655.1 PIG-L family deacetylase [Kiritimatiellia bacterium]
MTTPYHAFVEKLAGTLGEARHLPLGGFSPPSRRGVAADAPLALIFAPHPDDECIIGLLPLRLAAESGWRILNVPVTHGSLPARQAERSHELAGACAYLGWEIAEAPPAAGEQTHPPFSVAGIASLLLAHRPSAVFLPHEGDWNSRHIFTHRLVMDALAEMNPGFACAVIETEFWGVMDDPNLSVEGAPEQVAELVAATSFHAGEVSRNPYHLLLPAWMMDNVRRGAELVGGQGRASPDFTFATLYRLRQWSGGSLHRAAAQFLPVTEPAAHCLHGNHPSA